MLALDTHILIGFLRGDLRPGEHAAMQGQRLGVSAIVFWELFDLVQRGRVRIDLDDPEFNRDLGRFHVWPLSLHVCRHLRLLDFDADPADEIIAATSLAHDVPLLTRDQRILASKVVPLAHT